VTGTDAIVIDGLFKDYRGLRPLRMKRLVVKTGERVAVSGLDATAAEVLVNLVNGAILPDQGDVRVYGQSTRAIGNETEWLASLDRFGVVTPRAVLLEASSLEQNLTLPFTIDLDNPDAETQTRRARLADEVGLDAALMTRRVADLPAETRMRVHLARALATDPVILLLEHPTVPLPRDRVIAFARIVERIARDRGLALLAITEDADFAGVVATAHYRLQGGTGALVNARRWRLF
jgi:ABC-type lipoprotein export system ATPase subunit